MADSTEFLGTGWAFPPTFTKGLPQGLAMASGVEDIRQSLLILLRTTLGERVMQPDYGGALEKLLFDPMNDYLIAQTRSKIQNAILLYESRIVLEEVNMEVSQAEGQLLIILDFTIASENTRYNMVFPFYFNEATNINR
jgi:uncharacterized protein